jgi:hypothetical protein
MLNLLLYFLTLQKRLRMQMRFMRSLSLVAVIAIGILSDIPALELDKTGQSGEKVGAISTWVSVSDVLRRVYYRHDHGTE